MFFWSATELRVSDEDDFVLLLPENFENNLTGYLTTMITSIQKLASIIRAIPEFSGSETKRKNEEFAMIHKFRASYNSLSHWNRMNGTNNRLSISGQEYWDFVTQVQVFRQMHKLGDVQSELSLTGFTTPPETTLLRRRVLSATHKMEREFITPLYDQIQEQRTKATG